MILSMLICKKIFILLYYEMFIRRHTRRIFDIRMKIDENEGNFPLISSVKYFCGK